MSLSDMRVSYGNNDDPLDASWLDNGWFALFDRWIHEAVESTMIPEPNAMVLGTVDEAGNPQTRTVLCKNADSSEIVFFTNTDSDKARAMAAHPRVSVTFPWIALHRQVHIRGTVSRVDTATTETYWASRPRASRLGAWASDQSQPIASLDALNNKLMAIETRFNGVNDVPVPPHWGGYRIAVDFVEFWQGGHGRLHNRIRATMTDGEWNTVRVQP